VSGYKMLLFHSTGTTLARCLGDATNN